MSKSVAGALPTRQDLTVTYRPIAFVNSDPRNARTHPKRQIEQLCASLSQFGFTNPVLVDKDGVLIAGHGRLRAARGLGMERIPTIELVGLTAVQKKALRMPTTRSRSMPAGTLKS